MRRAQAIGLILLSAVASSSFAVPCHADQASGEVAGLKDILEKGLKARLPQDFAFIGKVIAMVENNQLPRELVLGTFDWVRKNRGHKKYLVAYFAQVLRIRAKEIGVVI